MKKWFAVIGKPIAHSLSPSMHSAWLKEQHIDASYIPILVEEEKLQDAVNSLKLLGCSGWNVTVPYKEAIIPYLDEIDQSARGIGAVNTVVKTEDGRFVGYNTDGLGFIESLGPISRTNHILIVGAGGAARGIAHAFKQLGFSHIAIANRTYANAQRLVEELQLGQAITLEVAEETLEQFDIIIHTTPQGMKNSSTTLPIQLNQIKEHAIVADIVYNPLVTPFLEEAKKYNVRTVNGLGMLVHQGAIAFSYWNGVKPNTEQMVERLTEQLGGNYVNR
ncbi:shikimate dehydrogenase [Psychrobacillus sp. NEAU-3TGS]|uniref:shikimate dehydrogenase n=1 Tax=Psychrobacillus sp. NEAU-3TGS TaxID=2995412 RepID=UPI002497DE4F|nr:shikimate dehydrogenase [Psychrobacillus sp. NEAU-3TGS]MDI2588189.1 shikimate dehydrogenase [Psychrobacillus sp. NEAU-3TGS]